MLRNLILSGFTSALIVELAKFQVASLIAKEMFLDTVVGKCVIHRQYGGAIPVAAFYHTLRKVKVGEKSQK